MPRRNTAMASDVYEAAAIAIRLFRTTLDRYAAELSEIEAALRQMRDDPPADREARHRRAVQRVIDLTATTEREMARARATLEKLGTGGCVNTALDAGAGAEHRQCGPGRDR
jgi:hypothetical protein